MISSVFVAAALMSMSGLRQGPADPNARVPTLCFSHEQPIFTCRLKNSVASICWTQGRNVGSKDLVYRFGRHNDVRFVYPKPKATVAPMRFRYSAMNYTGGEEQHLRFSAGRYDYTAFHAFEGGCCDKAGHRENSEEAGIVVRRSGRVISTLMCKDPARSTILEDGLPREDFVPTP